MVKNIVDTVSEELHISKKEAQRVIKCVFDSLTDILVSEKKVRNTDLGTFMVKRRAEKYGVNPKTGAKMIIPEHNVIVFKASTSVLAKIK